MVTCLVFLTRLLAIFSQTPPHEWLTGKCLLHMHACMCVCLHVHVCVRYRVCWPDDAGHHDPSGEEETGLHPWAHPDGGDLCGGPGAGARGTDTHTHIGIHKLSAFSLTILLKNTSCSLCVFVCVCLCLSGLPQAHVWVRPSNRSWDEHDLC